MKHDNENQKTGFSARKAFLPAGLCLILTLFISGLSSFFARNEDLYRPALKEAAHIYVTGLSLNSDIDKIAVKKIDGDVNSYFNEVLTEFLSKLTVPNSDNLLIIIGKTALDGIPVPPTHDGFIKKLHQEYQVKAILSGSIIDHQISFGRATVTASVTLNRLPTQETIHSVSNLQGTAVLPIWLFILFWLPALLLLLSLVLTGRGVIVLLESRTHDIKIISDQSKTTKALEVQAQELNKQSSVHNEFEKLTALIKEIIVLVSDVMILSNQNNLEKLREWTDSLGRFLRDENEQIMQMDQTRAETRERLKLTDEDVQTIVQTDLDITESLNGIKEILKQVLNDFQKQELKLDHIATMYETLHVKGNLVRDKFRERSELFYCED